MKIHIGAFPISFFTAKCSTHNCWVAFRLQHTTDRTDQYVVGAQLVPIRCEVGGDTSDAVCTDKWTLAISGTGDVTISQ